MNEKQNWTELILQIAIVLGPTLATWIALMLRMSIAQRQAVESIAIAVQTVNQKRKETLKAMNPDSKLTEDQAKQLRDETFQVALSIAPDLAKKVLAAWTSEARDNVIEAKVAESNK